jgi:putative CocE/NonD family hydrolase
VKQAKRGRAGGLATAAVAGIARRALGLEPPRTRRVVVEADLEVPMSDGVTLLTNRWYPADDPRAPIVLIRSPYGRGLVLSVVSRFFAQAGYQVVVQSCRGTSGSGGEFVPFRNERSDGLDTLGWLEAQPWFTDRVGLWGGSYLGITQWAVADELPPYVRAMALSITASASGVAVVYPGGALALDTAMPWAFSQEIATREGLFGLLLRRRGLNRRVDEALTRLPLGESDHVVLGAPLLYYRDWLKHEDPADPWWQDADFRASVDRLDRPVTMSGGWYDMFLPDLLDDFQRLTARGLSPRLVVGPWGHGGREHTAVSLRQAFALFDAELRGRPREPGPAVRLKLVGGGDRWLEFDSWPPAGRDTVWHLTPGRGLSEEPATAGRVDTYDYDPADPTPGMGGTSLRTPNTGPKDQSRRESRADVLTYTSARLARRRTFIGPAEATIHLQSSARSADVHVTICDVDDQGVSTNVSAGIQHIANLQPGVTTEVVVRLWPLGAVFEAGHRIRVQVASGAHPTYARNLGTGEPIIAASRIEVAHQAVHLGGPTDSCVRIREFGRS